MNREIKFRGKDKKPCDLEPTKTTGTVEAMLSCVETAFNQRMNSMKTINEVKLAEKNTPLGRFQKERQALPAIALTTDTSVLTALSNDYSFDIIFSQNADGT